MAPDKTTEKTTHVVCGICLDEMDDATCTYACGHRFHSTCIQIWLAENSTCPTCRITIGPDGCGHDTHPSGTTTAVITHLRNLLVIARRELQEATDAIYAFQEQRQEANTVFVSIM